MFGRQHLPQTRAHYPRQSVVICVFKRIKMLMIILYKLVDFVEVLRIKVVALCAEVSFKRLGKELRVVCISLGDFVIMAQCWIIALTLWLEKVLDFALRLAWIGLQANKVAEFFPTSLRFYPNVILNLFLQVVNARLYNRVLNLTVLSPKPTFLFT